jgi:hypothetical protein
MSGAAVIWEDPAGAITRLAPSQRPFAAEASPFAAGKDSPSWLEAASTPLYVLDTIPDSVPKRVCCTCVS